MDNKQEEKKSRTYKIEVGDKIKVYKKTVNGMTFHNTRVKQKKIDGEIDYFVKQLQFKKGVNVANGETIQIKRMFENLRKNPKDDFNPISSLMILEFDRIKSGDEEEQSAIDEYKSYVDLLQEENEYLDSSDLPF